MVSPCTVASEMNSKTSLGNGSSWFLIWERVSGLMDCLNQRELKDSPEMKQAAGLELLY